jgi:hypothetical protein
MILKILARPAGFEPAAFGSGGQRPTGEQQVLDGVRQNAFCSINQRESHQCVSMQLGHASIQLTADLYRHLFKETRISPMNKPAPCFSRLSNGHHAFASTPTRSS